MANEDKERGTEDDERAGEGSSGGGSGFVSSLKSKEVLLPAAISAIGAVAASAGPALLRRLVQSTEDKGQDEAERLGHRAAEGAKNGLGGGGGIAGKALSKALGGGGSSGGKKTRRLPIQRWTDVAVPVEKAYKAWTTFDQYPKFMHRVVNVEQRGDDKLQWQEKIWFSKRQWEGRITDRRENDRIAWKTTSGMSHKGVVSFHRLGDNLTRVLVTLEFEPNGMIEKMASGLRFVKRAVQADLARYKAFVEMEDAEGIEYRAVEEDGDGDERENGEGARRAGRNGQDDSEREQDRRERQSRREDRRETVGAS